MPNNSIHAITAEEDPTKRISQQSYPNIQIKHPTEKESSNLRRRPISADPILNDAADGTTSHVGEPDIIHETKHRTSDSDPLTNPYVGEDGDVEFGELPPDVDQQRGSFGDIVLYNREGDPYIDINRLVFKPKPRKRINASIEEQIFYWPDYLFIFCNFISVMGSMYLFLAGTTAISWTSSLDSVSGLNQGKSQSILTPSLGETSSGTIGLYLIGIGTLNIINVVFGTHAIVVGYKTVLILHLIADVVIVGAEFTLGGIMNSGKCDEADMKVFEERFLDYVKNYATPEPDVTDANGDIDRIAHRIKEIQLDTIQIALSCCGLKGWGDYTDSSVIGTIKKTNLDGSELVFPSSCCRPWWVRNIYCAHDAHLWTSPTADQKTKLKFRERINQEGCLEQIQIICRRALFLLGPGVLILAGVHTALICAESTGVFFHIRDILTLVRERRRLTKQDGQKYDEDLDESDASLTKEWAGGKVRSAVDELKARLPLPTEDQINLIKARSDFNTFEAQVKRTHIGKWMTTARRSVNIISHEIRDVDNEASVDLFAPQAPRASVESVPTEVNPTVPQQEEIEEGNEPSSTHPQQNVKEEVRHKHHKHHHNRHKHH